MADPNKLFIRIIDAYEANNMLLYEQLLDEINRNIKNNLYPLMYFLDFASINGTDKRLKSCFSYIAAEFIFNYIFDKEYYKSFIHLINYADDCALIRIFQLKISTHILDLFILHTPLKIYDNYPHAELSEYAIVRKTIQHKGIGYLSEYIKTMNATNYNYKILNLYFKYAKVEMFELISLTRVSFMDANMFIISLLVYHDLLPKTFDILFRFYKFKNKVPVIFNKYLDRFDEDHEFENTTNDYFWERIAYTKFCNWFIDTFPHAITATPSKITELIDAKNLIGLRFVKKLGLKPTAADLRNAPHEVRKIFF